MRQAGLIDLHSHILPALDDGALDVDDSVAMALVAQDDGIAAICATPHIRSDHDVRIEQIPRRVRALQDELDSRGVRVRILAGGELAQSAADGLDAGSLRDISLGGGGWVLLEPAAGALSEGLDELVARLAAQGLRVVLAHPERHAGADFGERLRALAARGVLIQWTADFLARVDPDSPPSLIGELAREGLVHLLGSDAHSSHGGRELRLRAGFERLGELATPAWAQWSAYEAPAAIVRGEPVAPPAP